MIDRRKRNNIIGNSFGAQSLSGSYDGALKNCIEIQYNYFHNEMMKLREIVDDSEMKYSTNIVASIINSPEANESAERKIFNMFCFEITNVKYNDKKKIKEGTYIANISEKNTNYTAIVVITKDVNFIYALDEYGKRCLQKNIKVKLLNYVNIKLLSYIHPIDKFIKNKDVVKSIMSDIAIAKKFFLSKK